MHKAGSSDQYPRVLFLTSAAFNKITGGGVTFSNLFSGWPADCIATVHNDLVPVTTDVCRQYYRLGEAEVHRRGMWRHLSPAPAQASIAGVSETIAGTSTLRAVARLGRRVLFGSAMPDAAIVTPELERWVGAFRPQVLYTILGTNGMMELALLLRRMFNLALVVHVMDDWPAVAYSGGLLSWQTRRHMDRLLRELLQMADARLCIGDAMAEAYQRRYGLSFDVFQNPVDVQKWAEFGKRELAIRSPARLLYIGSVLPEAQLTSIVDCCRSVAALRRSGVNVVFDIYTPSFLTEQHRAALKIDDAIQLHDAIADDAEVFRQLASADILLLPVNFDVATVRYVRYSMPTKVPAYLFSGTPVLVYAPQEIAQADYACRAGWGYVVGRRNQTELTLAIERLLTDTALRKRLSQAARATAFEQHDATRVRQRFQDLMRHAGSTADRKQQRGERVWN